MSTPATTHHLALDREAGDSFGAPTALLFGLLISVITFHVDNYSPRVPTISTPRNCSRNLTRSASVAPRGTWIGSPKVISQCEKGSGI
jgi:hypothetical protein